MQRTSFFFTLDRQVNCVAAKRQAYYYKGITKLLTRNVGEVLTRSVSAMSLSKLLTMKANGSTKSVIYKPPPKKAQSCIALKTIVESVPTVKPRNVM